MFLLPHRSSFYQRLWIFYHLSYHGCTEVRDMALKDVLRDFLSQIAYIHLNIMVDEVSRDLFPNWYCHWIEVNNRYHRVITRHTFFDWYQSEGFDLHIDDLIIDGNFLYDDVREGRISSAWDLCQIDMDIEQVIQALRNASMISIALLIDACLLDFRFLFSPLFRAIQMTFTILTFGPVETNITNVELSKILLDELRPFIGSTLIERLIYVLVHIDYRIVMMLASIAILYNYYKAQKYRTFPSNFLKWFLM